MSNWKWPVKTSTARRDGRRRRSNGEPSGSKQAAPATELDTASRVSAPEGLPTSTDLAAVRAAPRSDGDQDGAAGRPAVQLRAAITTPGVSPSITPESLDELKYRVHRRLIQELDTSRLESLSPEEARSGVEAAARQILRQEAPNIVGLARDELIGLVVDEVLGLGPIEPLMRDPTISEVMVNGPDLIYFERNGRLNRANVRFRDNAHIMRIVERIVSPLGRRVDEASPMVDARLADGSRVNIIIPPVAPKAPTITIRKFRTDKMRMEDLIAIGTLTQEAARFLEACIRIRRNMLISGGTGSGKTTLLNALSAFIPAGERLVTIEDTTELKLQQPHVVTLEARPPSIEGRGEITLRDLVRNALRMRPDRIIVGECRGSEAFDMLQAMNTGHEGSLSTVHANSPRDALARIESMVLMAGFELPVAVVRQQITSAIDLIIQIARFADGSRKVVTITEVTGMEGNAITTQDIFRFEHEGLDENQRVLGSLRSTGIRPTFTPMFELAGIDVPADIFVGNRRW
jgi:pilus assembly protein CpaF